MELAENVVVANKFRLERELGRGGMGSVWLAHHEELDIPCAVKFIEGEAAHSAEMRERFTREAKAAAQLRSPHVVQILDQGVWDGVPYIAMELLDGEDLGKRLHRLGRIEPAQLVAVLSQVARALAKAHSAGIIHRDLKPENIFLVRDDERELVKILDFGIAKTNNQALGSSANTRTGTLMGTPYYMSPEQAQGNKIVDARSDVWAIGVIAFESLTGQKPFDSDALGDLLLKVCAHPIPPIRDLAPDLPPAVEAWWKTASSREPAQRFQTTKDLVDALATALGVAPGGELRAVSSAEMGAFGPASSQSANGRTVSPLTLGASEPRAKRSPVAWLALGAFVLLGGGVVAVMRKPAPGGLASQPSAVASVRAPAVVEAPTTAAPSVSVDAPTASATAPATAPAASVAAVAKVDAKPLVAAPVKTARPVLGPKKVKDEAGF